MFTATTTKTKQKNICLQSYQPRPKRHFVRICGNVSEKCENDMPNVVISWCSVTEHEKSTESK